MDKKTRDWLFDWYMDYAYSFAGKGGMLSPMKKLKFDHSMRVSHFAKKIAREEKWSESDILLAEIAGLYHDVARYRQYREYQTFRDHISINHAELGCKIMDETGCLDCLEERERRLIYESTRMHNMRDIPEGLDAEVERFLLLVRDSDKLDIFWVMYDAIANNRLDEYPEIAHGVDIEGPPTKEVVDAVLAGGSVNYCIAKSLVDFELILMQWFYDFHFHTSYRIIRDRKITQQLATILPDTPEIRQIVQNAKDYVGRRLRG